MLKFALSKLKRYSQELGVEDVIITEESDIGEYVVQTNYFDYIVAVSNCIIINTNVEEIDIESNEKKEPLFEIAMSTNHCLSILEEIYGEWEELNVLVKQLEFEIVRNERPTLLKSDCITFCSSKV